MLKQVTLCIGSVLLSAITYVLYKHNKKRESSESIYCRIIFFPDTRIACKSHFTDRHGCTLPTCKFSHDENSSYGQLMSALNKAQLSIDVCVFCITARELASLLCEASKRGIRVRVITDSEQLNTADSQITGLRQAGVQVRNDDTSFYMHHKFSIIDNMTLINGSFNWTRSAISGNYENVFITNDIQIVAPYIAEFNRLWDKFDPRKRQ